MKKKIELLAPAGDMEKIKIAIIYGADALYFSGENYSLRAGAGNLSAKEMEDAVDLIHASGKKAYLTLNIFPRNEDISGIRKFVKEIAHINLDAFIISDPGVINLIKEEVPSAEFHLSTQANMTNYITAKFWYELGIKRIVLARELTFSEISVIKANIPDDMELEAFCHGAMCISYSGRCLLSNFMTDRDSNRGLCSHPCRWKYSLMEEKRPGEYFPIEEDDRGTYIMNSKDMCMIEHIPDLINNGISSAKIEGRMKSIFYLATVINAYRHAIDDYYKAEENYVFNPKWLDEVSKVSHRKFGTGFYYNDKDEKINQNYETSGYIRTYSFNGLILDYDEKTGLATVEQRNKLSIGDMIEIFGYDADFFSQELTELYDANTGESLASAPHPQQKLKIRVNKPVKPYYMIRKKL